MILPNGEVIPENPNEEPETPSTHDVSFIITDGENPIQGATVTIGEITGTTGSAGGCTLRNVTGGEHTVSVVADGYESYSDDITVDETHISLTLELTAESPTTLDIPIRTVIGMTNDASSLTPLPNVTITVKSVSMLKDENDNDISFDATGITCTTDEDGYGTLVGFPLETYNANIDITASNVEGATNIYNSPTLLIHINCGEITPNRSYNGQIIDGRLTINFPQG